ncbi:group II intron reverse transcriptase/maturase [Nostoc sp.]|uniref:group II intron reverse transcriptase/maturase n=1 Tax=Nostoc sp. TaxID=1180 RepID=UPI002FFA80BA
MNKSNTELLKTTVEWKNIPWRDIERVVFKLQKRIFKAAQRGDHRAVRRLQKTLMKSWSAKVLAVRRVTQDNQGKKTAGIDGVKSLTPQKRLELVDQLRPTDKAKPVRRVWIDKPGKTEKRPLGIPTMNDRATQALVKAALEPEWEAKFELNSYGFRPGRSCHDAIGAIFIAIRLKPKYVLDADIAKCFDRINHDSLLKKLNTFPTIRRQIRAWLKAGVIDWSTESNNQSSYTPTSEGTPQGGVLSPLLANIALHGMENRIKQYAETLPTRAGYGKKVNRGSLSLIRYADDFVILHEDKAVVQRCQQIIIDWLKDMGLELKPEKTRLSHTLIEESGNVGFDFLGFHIQQYKVGKFSSKQGFKTIITPSKKALKEHTNKVGNIIEQHKNAPKEALIARLNPVITGWCNYYKTVCSQDTFEMADFVTFHQLFGWADKRHRSKKAAAAEWKKSGTRNWVFASNDGQELKRHDSTPITRHVKVRGDKTPYDGDWVYWSKRRGEYPGTMPLLADLLKSQKGKCSHCNMYFTSESLIEIHHVDGNHNSNKRTNLKAVHRHCHDIIHGKWETQVWEMRSDDSYQPIP